MYSLPTNYWFPSVLKGIGNELGEYIKMLKGTRNGYYVSYARICLYMDVSRVLPKVIKLVFRDGVWLQNIDYGTYLLDAKYIMTTDIS